MSLPFLDPDNNLNVNLSIIIIIVSVLSQTKRKKLVLNNSRLHTFLYLTKNPVALNQILNSEGKQSILLGHEDTLSVNTISINFDPLLDREAMKALIIILISKGIIVVTYKKNDGFFYSLSDVGKIIASSLTSDYANDIRSYCEQMTCLQSLTESKLNQSLNKVMKLRSSNV